MSADERPSKSARKREAQAIRELADRLVELPASVLAEACHDEAVLDAVAQAREMTSHGANRRQRQYIARLLRDRDVAPLRALVAASDNHDEASRQQFRRAEKLRADLLSGDAARRDAALARVDDVARDELSRLLGNYAAARNPAAEKPIAKKIFRACHDALQRADAAGGRD